MKLRLPILKAGKTFWNWGGQCNQIQQGRRWSHETSRKELKRGTRIHLSIWEQFPAAVKKRVCLREVTSLRNPVKLSDPPVHAPGFKGSSWGLTGQLWVWWCIRPALRWLLGCSTSKELVVITLKFLWNKEGSVRSAIWDHLGTSESIRSTRWSWVSTESATENQAVSGTPN